MRIFSVPPPTDTLSEPKFYDTISKIRLRQQLEMYSICKYILCLITYVSIFKIDSLGLSLVGKGYQK